MLSSISRCFLLTPSSPKRSSVTSYLLLLTYHNCITKCSSIIITCPKHDVFFSRFDFHPRYIHIISLSSNPCTYWAWIRWIAYIYCVPKCFTTICTFDKVYFQVSSLVIPPGYILIVTTWGSYKGIYWISWNSGPENYVKYDSQTSGPEKFYQYGFTNPKPILNKNSAVWNC